MSSTNAIILVVAVAAVIAILGLRARAGATGSKREVVRRDENDDA
jgi:hypothetical protein